MDKDQLQKKLLATFKIEAAEHIQAIFDGLLQLEKIPLPANVLQIIELLHRETHSLKGAARAVDLMEIELICQAVEKIFSAWKKQTLQPDLQQVNILQQAFSLLETAINTLNNNIWQIDKLIVSETITKLDNLFSSTEISTETIDDTKKKVTAVKPIAADSAPNIQTVRVESVKLDALLLKIEEMLTVKLAIKKYTDDFTFINDLIKSWKRDWNKTKNTTGQSIDTITLEAINRIKALETRVNNLHSRIINNNYQFNTIIDSLLEDAKEVVLIPFTTLLNSFPMMIKNLANEQKKSINFIMSNTEIKIDKRILDELKDPLIHLLRNSVDHGIEKPEERKNKATVATIKIEILQPNDNEIEILLSDDGRGINLEMVKQVAIKQGYVTVDEINKMNEQELLSLVYLSGVSTSKMISTISGQGLGMAIAKEKIEKIGGSITINSKLNVGTTVKIIFPLSLTTFKGVLIKSASLSFIMPTAHLERIVRIPYEDIRTIENKQAIQINSITVSLVSLHEILGITHRIDNKNNRSFIAAIISIDNKQVAFQIEGVEGSYEGLVKKLNKPLIRVKYISAMTILESGEPVPILNVNDLIKTVIKDIHPIDNKLINVAKEIKSRKPILIVEDSITTRMLLKNILEMVGYTVQTAVDGIDAWSILKENDFALVLSDVEMPRMDGLQLTKNIRRDKQLADLPVILITTHDAPEDRQNGIEAGASAYIGKNNFDDDNLIKIIKRLI